MHAKHPQLDTDEENATVNLCDSEQDVVLGSVENKDIRLNTQSQIDSYDLSLSNGTGSGFCSKEVTPMSVKTGSSEQDVFLGSIRLNKDTPRDFVLKTGSEQDVILGSVRLSCEFCGFETLKIKPSK